MTISLKFFIGIMLLVFIVLDVLYYLPLQERTKRAEEQVASLSENSFEKICGDNGGCIFGNDVYQYAVDKGVIKK